MASGYDMIFPSSRVRIMAALIKNELRRGPFTGTVFVFRSRKADRLKLIAAPIETRKFKVFDPLAYLTSTLTAFVNGRKQSPIDKLLPWNCLVK
ncbi:IS66 family insertion sequence element accessory protein TnpB [Rhizobium sp. TRM95796]|uniref:IS66 family insertion sequence element accessory protein TnpB n=1 Tax=Rhizobium sp. TRM95796 TaxID=2979862 RepID=UPI003995643A